MPRRKCNNAPRYGNRRLAGWSDAVTLARLIFGASAAMRRSRDDSGGRRVCGHSLSAGVGALSRRHSLCGRVLSTCLPAFVARVRLPACLPLWRVPACLPARGVSRRAVGGSMPTTASKGR